VCVEGKRGYPHKAAPETAPPRTPVDSQEDFQRQVVAMRQRTVRANEWHLFRHRLDFLADSPAQALASIQASPQEMAP
jgi:hypothetical protein